MNLEDTEKNLKHEIEWQRNNGVLVGLYHEKIKEFETLTNRQVSIQYGSILLTGAKREELLTFIKIFGGRWDKSVEEYYPDKIRYSQTITNPISNGGSLYLHITQAEPPAACQIIETEELVPAGIRKVKKIVCKKSDDEVPVATDEVTEKELEPTPSVEEQPPVYAGDAL